MRRHTPFFGFILPLALLLTACGGGGSSSASTSTPTTPPQGTMNRSVTLTRNLVGLGGFMAAPGVTPGTTPLVVTQKGGIPLMVPALAPTAMQCPTVTYGMNSFVMDYSGCTDMSGSVSVDFSSDANGVIHENLVFNNFGYHFTLSGASYASSMQGSVTLEGTLGSSSGTTHTYSWRVRSGANGLSCSFQAPGISEAWTQIMDLTTTVVSHGTSMQMTEFGSASYAGTLGTCTAVIPQDKPLLWDTATCFYPQSGTIQWMVSGTPVTAIFGLPCGTVTLNGSQVIKL